MISIDAASMNVFSALGALYDIAGAVLLARALVFVRARLLMRQSISGWGGVSLTLIKMFSEQQVDATSGLLFLVVGFTLQAIVGFGLQNTSYGTFAAGLVILLSAIITYFLIRPSVTRWIFTRACRTHKREDGTSVWSEEEISALWDRVR